MTLGKHLGFAFATLLALVFASCSGGGSSSDSSSNSIDSVVQDLTLDPDGLTTVITFDSSKHVANADVANFVADGGQTALGVTVDGDEVTVTWDARVTPSDRVKAVGLTDVSTSYHDVETSDDSAPTFTITEALQNPSLGGDTIEVTFSGPRVVAAAVEDPANWDLVVNSQSLDLTDSTFDFDAPTQVLQITLGTMANLHASFTLAASNLQSVADVAVSGSAVLGAATGDTTAPTLLSAEQNLGEDEFGRVVDFTFSEAMDPVFSVALGHFAATLPDVSTSVEQVAEDVLRVTFNGPIIPGHDTINLTNLVDLHGNDFTDAVQPITQAAPVVNAYDVSSGAVTVENVLGDYLSVVTTQAFDPDSAIDPASWTLVVDGNPVTMADQTLEYDFLAKTLTITLDFDMTNGTAFTLTANNVLDVDGDDFTDALPGLVDGELVEPSVNAVVQNRGVDPSGLTLDVAFSEDVAEVAAETLANYTISGTQTLQSATLLSNHDTVRLVFDEVVVPGDFTLDVDGIVDLAGNAMSAPQAAIAITTTDSTQPTPTLPLAAAIAGANNDTLTITFDDDMLESEVELAASWTVESPVGSPQSTVGASVSYDSSTKKAVLTFANGFNFQSGDDFNVTLAAMRDLGGNTVDTTTIDGTVDAESTLPYVHTVYFDSSANDEVVVRFSEPCTGLEDMYDAINNPGGARYVLRDNLGVLRGVATSAVSEDDGLGARVSFGFVVAATDTLDVFGAVDLAGNAMFPKLLAPLQVEDTTEPSLNAGFSALTSVSGESNDIVTVVFDRPMSPWGILDPANYGIGGPLTLDLSRVLFTFNGTDTVTIHLARDDGHNLQTGITYDLSINNLWSAQGAQRTLLETEFGIAVAGDSTAPTVPVGKVRIDPLVADSLLLEFTEAVDAGSASTNTNYDYDGGNVAFAAELLGPRVARITFGVTPVIGQNLDFDDTDLAGNASGVVTRAVTAADAAAPLVSNVAGVITPGYGSDYVTVTFNEPVTGASCLAAGNYSIQSGATTLSLTGAQLTYATGTSTVTIRLAGGQELDAAGALTVTISGVEDFSGNAMPAPVVLGGAVSGDALAPTLSSAFVDYDQDATGKVVDVLFSEDVDATIPGLTASWTASGGQTVQSVTLLQRNHARLVLSAALGAAQTLGITGVEDLAQNAAGALSINPAE